MSKPLYISEAGVHGRRTIIRKEDAICEICNNEVAVSVDTSDEEYQSFNCCGPCFNNLWLKMKEVADG